MKTNPNEPISAIISHFGGTSSDGLTKIEYMATMAMQGMLANPALMEAVTSEEVKNGTASEKIGRKSVELAQELIKALNEPQT
jgi:hypothetical protein